MVKEFEASTAPHFRAFCHDNSIDLASFRPAYFPKNWTGNKNSRLDQALSQIAADSSVDSESLLIKNAKNAKKELLDLLLIPDGAPYYDFEDQRHNFTPVRDGDMFVVYVSRQDGSRPGISFYAIVEDEVLAGVKLEKALAIALREVSVSWRCNPRDLMGHPNIATREEFVGLLMTLNRKGVHLKRSIAERFPELNVDLIGKVAA